MNSMRKRLVQPVDAFTAVVIVGSAIALFSLGYSRYYDQIVNEKAVASHSVSIAATEVESLVNSRRRIVQNFVQDNLNTIRQLAHDPDNDRLKILVNTNLRRYLPDLFTVNIATTTGNPIIDDFDGNLGDVCINDMKLFSRYGANLVRVHPNNNLYHYDIIVPFPDGKHGKLFFASFGLMPVARILKATEPVHHNLLITTIDNPQMIEATSAGARNVIRNRSDFRLTDTEKDLVDAGVPVNETRWQVVSIRDTRQSILYRDRLLQEGLLTYTAFLMVVLLLRRYLAREERQRRRAEARLMVRSQEVEDLNEELLIKNKQLAKTIMTDQLTGLYNRRYFDHQLAEEWYRAARSGSFIALAMVDIDCFKQYNDTYGHQKGDYCLKTVGHIMSHMFRRAGEFVARYGGEEFAVVLVSTDPESSHKDLERLVCNVERNRLENKGSTVSEYITISAGIICTRPALHDDLDRFIAAADKALYCAKRNGRNQVVMGAIEPVSHNTLPGTASYHAS